MSISWYQKKCASSHPTFNCKVIPCCGYLFLHGNLISCDLNWSLCFSECKVSTHLCVSGGKKCSFFGKFDVLCFLKTPLLRFSLLPYYRRTQCVISQNVLETWGSFLSISQRLSDRRKKLSQNELVCPGRIRNLGKFLLPFILKHFKTKWSCELFCFFLLFLHY